MKEQIEKQFNISLKDKLNYSEKNIYSNFVYFFKKEIQEDHYFKDLKTNKVYVLRFNKDNYDPSITETGKFTDSFKIPIENCEKIIINDSYKYAIIDMNKDDIIKSPKQQIFDEIKNLLSEAINKLNQLEKE